jgi:predicted transcriptional regulator
VPTLYARAMRRAADIVGVSALATRLGVSQRQLELWMRGLAEPPAEIFLKVADILGEKTVDDLRPSGEADSSAERSGKA